MMCKFIVISFVVALFLEFYISSVDNAVACPGGWLVSNQGKCYQLKVTTTADTHDADLKACNSSSAIFFTIESIKDLDDLRAIYNNVTDKPFNIFIGLKYDNSTKNWVWDDGTPLGTFTNWASGSDTSGTTLQCVTVKVGYGLDYTWIPVNCATEKQANILCLLNSGSSLDQIKKDIDELKKKMLNVATVDTIIPKGFIYVQLPTQPTPEKLWSTLKWEDVSHKYDGLFFRTVGTGSGKFDDKTVAVQPESNLNNFIISTRALTTVSYAGMSDITNTTLVNGKMSDELCHGQALNSIKMLFAERDNRPKNTAVRVWQRL